MDDRTVVCFFQAYVRRYPDRLIVKYKKEKGGPFADLARREPE